MDLRPGDVFAGFTVERELGAGGMGEVYLARHPRLPRRVALKLLRADLVADQAFVHRFQREAEIVAGLEHPAIVPIDDCGVENGRFWFSMRYVDGITADEALAPSPHRLDPQRAVRIIERVASALDFAHRQNMVHRDVKPANILLAAGTDGEPEQVFLSDFGVAKGFGELEALAPSLTMAGGVVATVDYAAPEQIESHPLDGRCDVYALGCVLYKLLTGRIPFPGETLAAKVFARMQGPAPVPSALAPELPRGLDQVVARALERDRDRRYQTCRELAVAARAALASAGGPDQATTTTLSAMGLAAAYQPGPPSFPPASHTGTFGQTGVPGQPMPTSLNNLLGTPAPSQAGRSRKRSLLAIGIVVAVAAALVGVLSLTGAFTGSTTGQATTAPATSAPLTDSSGPASPTTSPPPTSVPVTSAPPTTVPPTTAPPTSVLPTAVFSPLPRAASPLPTTDIVVSGAVDGGFALQAVDSGLGAIRRLGEITPTAAGPVLSPDRRTLLLLQDNTLRVRATDGTGDRLLFAAPADCDQLGLPAWSAGLPDQLVLPCTGTGGQPLLLVVDLTGAVLQQLPLDGLLTIGEVSLSPDGKTVLFGGTEATGDDDDDDGGGKLWTQRLKGSDKRTAIIDKPATQAQWSPDGTRIAFQLLDNDLPRIAVADVDGSNLQILTDDAGPAQGPSWSPDGAHVAYSKRLDGVDVLMVAPASQGEERRIGRGIAVSGSPAWGAR